MANPGPLIKSFIAEAAISARSLVKPGASGGVVPAAAATDDVIGVSDTLDATLGQTVDVIMSGSAEVKLGGTVAAGKPVAANASGAGVAGAVGAGNVAVGYALQAGVSGDIIDVVLARHSVT